MSKVRINGGSDPMLIDSVNAESVDFLSIIFSSNWRSLRYWMQISVALGRNNLYDHPPIPIGLTDSFTSVAYGKTFNGYPLVCHLTNGNCLPALNFDASTPGQSGGFTIAASDHVVCANLATSGNTMKVLIIDQSTG